MKCLRLFALLGISLFVANALGAPTSAPAAKEGESSGLSHQASNAAPPPIIVKWHMKKANGECCLMVNSDGSYLFSGDAKSKEKDKDFDISLALKSSTGGTVIFHYVGEASHGVEWSKQGESEILKDDFKMFAGKVDWAAEYRYHLDKEGMAKLYKEREEKKEKMKKEDLEKERKAEAAQAAAAAKAQQGGGGGGGGGVVSDITSAASTVGSVISTVESVGSDILSFF
jgi:hypothetical protein